jgi:hypothetical protein
MKKLFIVLLLIFVLVVPCFGKSVVQEKLNNKIVTMEIGDYLEINYKGYVLEIQYNGFLEHLDNTLIFTTPAIYHDNYYYISEQCDYFNIPYGDIFKVKIYLLESRINFIKIKYQILN